MTTEAVDLLPLTALVPETAGEPIVIFDRHAALRIAIVERAGVKNLASEWDSPGNYILLDHKNDSGDFGTYVGQAATGGVRSRLLQHVKSKEHWQRAIVIMRDTTYGLNSAEVGWLEGRLWDLMDSAEYAKLHNGNRPKDETLPLYDRKMLEQAILPIQRLLRLIGYDVTPADEELNDKLELPSRKQPTGKQYFGVTIAQLTDAGYLPIGTKLVSTNSTWPASAVVVSGGIEYDSNTYKSPSTAGSAVKGGNAAVPGWAFWAVEEPTGIVPLATIRSRYLHDKQR